MPCPPCRQSRYDETDLPPGASAVHEEPDPIEAEDQDEFDLLLAAIQSQLRAGGLPTEYPEELDPEVGAPNLLSGNDSAEVQTAAAECILKTAIYGHQDAAKRG